MTTFDSPKATSDLSMWLRYLESIHTSAIDLGLDRVQRVAQRAKLTKPAPTVITVAGTNGKGSTCALMESILINAGYRVGVYSSPHLIRYNERIRINGNDLSDSLISQSFAAIEAWRKDISLSLFEFGTLSALWAFKAHQVDVVLLEVGLGGRLDATNVVDHDVSIITSLAVDHVDWLGDDIEVIGFEKAGIFRSEKPAICGQPNPPSSVAAHADDINADLYQVGYQFDYNVHADTQTWSWKSGAFDLDNLPLPNLPLANAATAIMALGVSGLELSDINIVEGLKSATLPGRMQRLTRGNSEFEPTIILDVAHNPHSAHYLVQQVRQRFPNKKIHAVVGMLHDKDIKSTLGEFTGVIDVWYPASLSGPRAANASELTAVLSKEITEYSSPVDAFKVALQQAENDDLILVFGSFHTVGEVWDYWKKEA
ncbi:bifunctional tetrahydrofolate synthase/dihydrofolate synthase [Aliivibrio fischeri]|uniref:bifunctional tetrahydrofolate synthase/dihydrofolate synthase n=1 Tax=Aliivibrio fischeri TaxID=668 RepID=UPI0002FC7E37|nr:bifunctional tetrahydrofolate synthase/dihydrofolate synthase [Aliivibrio fischeri]MCE4934744.1 bifunctional tetrahydrofolate synthase/dihydrofolate synthase [Aliivibrio fischeri]MUH97833.1 bifunctional tetrahydrofolate synthase/dihydrofolate synthase [Aliivibrio fischeri]MUI63282.1 bifunctional tetrahydrofolate synthase/dihydrofolate synthase [Aliivibrio fischeri]OCH06737.1 bifunctional folylpolyglutamate synthase/dihydrofolate synthase [Aliivibrio fischeri]OCH10930.1 bifunctional folylpol